MSKQVPYFKALLPAPAVRLPAGPSSPPLAIPTRSSARAAVLMVHAWGSSKPITPPSTPLAIAAAEAAHPPPLTSALEEAFEIEDTLSWSPRRACEYLYGQVYSTVTSPKVVVGVSFDDDAAVPVLDCDLQLRSVSVFKVSVWYVYGVG